MLITGIERRPTHQIERQRDYSMAWVLMPQYGTKIELLLQSESDKQQRHGNVTAAKTCVGCSDLSFIALSRVLITMTKQILEKVMKEGKHRTKDRHIERHFRGFYLYFHPVRFNARV